MKCAYLVVVLLAALHSVTEARAREWTSRSGKASVDAELVKVQDGKAWLRRSSDRKLFALPVSSLSYRNRRLLKTQFPNEITHVIEKRYPSYVSRFELASPKDLYYARVVERVNGSVEVQLDKWPMLKQLKEEWGEYIGDALDAPAIAAHRAMYCRVDDCETPLAPIRVMVEDCAKILDVPLPNVFVRNEPEPQAYLFGLAEPNLVLTSGLIALYEDDPDELRFVIGHELGHLKCRHVQMLWLSRAVMELLRAVEGAIIQVIERKFGLPGLSESGFRIATPLYFGQFLSWSRQAEITADRAGLLCCQDPEVAIEALYRLKHGVPTRSRYYDENKKLDVDSILQSFEYWENRSLQDLLLEVHRYRSTHPFIEDRMAFVQRWFETGAMDEILSRQQKDRNPTFYLGIERVGVFRFAEDDEALDPYLMIYNGDQHWCRSITLSEKQSTQWSKFPTVVRHEQGKPVFFELWSKNMLQDSLVGMFAIYPEAGKTNYTVDFQRHITQRSASVSHSPALVKVSVDER